MKFVYSIQKNKHVFVKKCHRLLFSYLHLFIFRRFFIEYLPDYGKIV
jgi:hypothetical protein